MINNKINKQIAIIFSLLLFLIITRSYSQPNVDNSREWKLFSYKFTKEENLKWYYDTLSIKKNEDILSCWVKKDNLDTQENEDYCLYEFYISCLEMTYCVNKKFTFYRNGSNTTDINECKRSENIKPETIPENLFRKLCK